MKIAIMPNLWHTKRDAVPFPPPPPSVPLATAEAPHFGFESGWLRIWWQISIALSVQL